MAKEDAQHYKTKCMLLQKEMELEKLKYQETINSFQEKKEMLITKNNQ